MKHSLNYIYIDYIYLTRKRVNLNRSQPFRFFKASGDRNLISTSVTRETCPPHSSTQLNCDISTETFRFAGTCRFRFSCPFGRNTKMSFVLMYIPCHENQLNRYVIICLRNTSPYRRYQSSLSCHFDILLIYTNDCISALIFVRLPVIYKPDILSLH